MKYAILALILSGIFACESNAQCAGGACRPAGKALRAGARAPLVVIRILRPRRAR